MQHLTISAKWLTQAADQLDRDAEQSLQAWVLLGQSNRYSETKTRARMLRRAAEIKNIGERREYLHNNGEQV
jgi:hypothetical protein